MMRCQKRAATAAAALASTAIAAASGGAQKGVRYCVYRQRIQHKMNTSPIRLVFLVCFPLLSTAIAYAQDCSRMALSYLFQLRVNRNVLVGVDKHLRLMRT